MPNLNKVCSGLFILVLALLAPALHAQELDRDYVKEHYFKKEVQIPMRDGIKLFTAIYIPKDTSITYPVIMSRTPYTVAPYGEDKFPYSLGRNPYMMKDGYIYVYQDVRGRYMSEGTYENMRPIVAERKSDKDIDESTDTYDTIEWIINNVPYTNKRFGQKGISYPGHYTTAGAVYGHPALLASSPQAPIGDFFFDDFHHNGAFLQSYWIAVGLFGYQKDSLTTESWFKMPRPETPDGYQFYMDMGPLKNADKWYGEDNEFWQQIINHPNYDEFWQKRGIIQHLHSVHNNVLTVGGWFDAEDLYGPLNTYKGIEHNGKPKFNGIVMGPWSHGDWARERGSQAVGNVYFGDSLSTYFQKNIEREFFKAILHDQRAPELPDATVFDTGTKEWRTFDAWPPKAAEKVNLYAAADEKLLVGEKPAKGTAESTSFISDPNKPVPYTEEIKVVFTPRKYMSDDQRFASRRPDVLTFETDVLEDDITLAGEIMAKLKVATTGTSADWIVKLIDVYPADHEDYEHNPRHIKMGGYQQMVRSEVLRGRFRNSFSKPEPFVPNKMTDVNFRLQDVMHTFKKGHKIMIHIQSTWFPLIDRNPQKYVDNIYKDATEADFIKATHTVFHSADAPTAIEVQVLKK